MIAVADYGQYGHLRETSKNPDGSSSEEFMKEIDGREIAIPSILERALICRQLDWRVLPEDLLDKNIELKKAMNALMIFDAMRIAATDLSKLSPEQQKILLSITEARDSLKS